MNKKSDEQLNSGAYLLVMRLDRDVRMRIGKLGAFNFPQGYYVYVGSAMKNLKQRVARHFSDKKKMHWHIDYFLDNASIERAFIYPSKRRLESKIASLFEREVDKGEAAIIVKKFGATDSNNKSHLFYFSTKTLLNRTLGRIRKEIKKL